jgi:hypothetical protein
LVRREEKIIVMMMMMVVVMVMVCAFLLCDTMQLGIQGIDTLLVKYKCGARNFCSSLDSQCSKPDTECLLTISTIRSSAW